MTLTETLLAVLIVIKALDLAYWFFRLEGKIDAVLNVAHDAKVQSRAANVIAGSVLKDSRELNEDTKKTVQEGVAATVVVAANLAAGISPVPPSDDKLPRPAALLPDPAG